MPETPAGPPPHADLRSLIAEAAERMSGTSAVVQEDEPAPASPALPRATSQPRPLGDAEVLEVEAVHRRQLLDALVHGASRTAPSRSGTGRGLLIGIAVAVAIALGVGLVAMVQATMTHGSPSKPAGAIAVHAVA